MRTSSLAAALVCAAAVLAAPAAATAGPATAPAVLDLHATRLEAPANFTVQAKAINDLGQVVGSISTHPVVWDAVTGKVRYLQVPVGYASGWANAINRHGVIVGAIMKPSGWIRAARWNTDGTVNYLTGENVPNNTAEAIDDQGHIAGLYGQRSVARFVNGFAETIGGLGTQGAVTGMSAGSGVVIGYFQTIDCPDCPHHGFEAGVNGIMPLPPAPAEGISDPAGIQDDGLRIAGTVNYQAVTWRIQLSPATHKPFWKRTTLGYLRPGAATYTTGMTGDGLTLVGYAEVDGSTRGWVRRDEAFAELPDGGSAATGINSSGTILGTINGRPVVWH